MCRSTEDPRFYQSSWRSRRRDRLNIRAFFLRFSINSFPPDKARKENSLPGSLTLHYLPRISGSPLDINGVPIPSDSPAFVTLHRVTSYSPFGDSTKEVVFASRERVQGSEGVRFEVYWGEEKVLKGVFRRKDYDDDDFINFIGEWKVDCRCALDSHVGLGLLDVSHAEVCIEIEGDDDHRVMSDKVEMTARRNKTKKKKSSGFIGLEEIPEQREVEDDSDSVPDGDSSSSSCCCCGGGGDGGGGGGGVGVDLEFKVRSEKGGGDGEVSGDEEKRGLELEIEGVRWAVDVGIWVMCLGVGYLLSRASSNSLRRRRRSFLF
ncbi:uncharacterized protein LOC122089207 [Macadamia integrifolia]|uniref:uncharacterized protein LOC122089207 n=1 Tax=Macadamia integrifolia TaxID=60698 RepID=UPI001C4F2B1F|nr:uncharacterized protein LOC122089207 [Macadamia integrifolia]